MSPVGFVLGAPLSWGFFLGAHLQPSLPSDLALQLGLQRSCFFFADMALAAAPAVAK